jgi:rare lipoprotein A
MPARRSLALLTSLCLFAHAAMAQSPTHAHPDAAGTPRASDASHASKVRKPVQRGKVSWYGRAFAGRKTASGERFDPRALTMAHRTLPLGAIVEVTNNANGKRVRLRVNDRGPYCDGRVADLSRAASERLGFADKGVTEATIRVVALPTTDAATG